MLTLYQAEWCPYSHRVRERLTELGIDFVAKQVAAGKDARNDLRNATGSDEIPVLVLDDGTVIDDWRAILGHLDEHHRERDDAGAHRQKLLEDAEARDPRSGEYPR